MPHKSYRKDGTPTRLGRPSTRRRVTARPKASYDKRKKTPEYDAERFIKKAISAELPEVKIENRFADFKMNGKLKENAAHRGYDIPTPIQDITIPRILEGRDVIGIASTGTGKTAAFLLPLIHKVAKFPRERVLILAPTRELGIQIDKEFRAFERGLGLRSTVIIGGAHMGEQLQSLKRHPHFVIATPGRLKDVIERKALDLSSFSNIVLDEMDRMLDMGFIKDIKYLLSLFPEKRQSLFFSATMPKAAEDLARTFLHDPIVLTARSRATSENVEQDVIRLKRNETKIEALHELLLKPEFDKVIIFGRTKRGVEKLSRELLQRGFAADAIHGDKTQSQRKRALNRFTRGEVSILVATDVAARGLDIPDVSHVINYELPERYEDYIHRIGRTGRGKKQGHALTFME